MKFLTLFSMLLCIGAGAEAAPLNGAKAQNLYRAMLNRAPSRCANGRCTTEMRDLECVWSNSIDSQSASCSYQSGGEVTTLEGPAAKKLADAVMASPERDISCGAGTCGFRNPLDVACSEFSAKSKDSKTKKESQASCQLSLAKAKEEAVERAAPSIETKRPEGNSGQAL